MGTTTLLFAVVMAAAPHGGITYPLAAAMVIDGKVSIIDVPSRTVTGLDFEGFAADEADLSFDKARVVFDARSKEGGPLRVYVADIATKKLTPIEALPGVDQRFPRFAEGGTSVLFVAAQKEGPGGPANPGRLWRFVLADKSVRQIDTPSDHCAFSPVGLPNGSIAYFSTTCFLNFDLTIINAQGRIPSKITSTTDSDSEVAAAPDGKTLVFTRADAEGRAIMARGVDERLRRLVAVPIDRRRLQPRFVCPKDLLFVNRNKVWALDTRSATLSELIDLRPPDAGSHESSGPESKTEGRKP